MRPPRKAVTNMQADDEADPMTREDSGRRRKLRKGREQCTAHRRDGGECLAPAVEGALVCRRHGGAAPQVQIKARHRLLIEASYYAHLEWQEARGTRREFGALCKALQAQRDLDAYEFKLRRLAELRAAVRELKASPAPEVPVT
jgi:hypothetical protein